MDGINAHIAVNTVAQKLLFATVVAVIYSSYTTIIGFLLLCLCQTVCSSHTI